MRIIFVFICLFGCFLPSIYASTPSVRENIEWSLQFSATEKRVVVIAKNRQHAPIVLNLISLQNPIFSAGYTYKGKEGKVRIGGWGLQGSPGLLLKSIKAGKQVVLEPGGEYASEYNINSWLEMFRKSAPDKLLSDPKARVRIRLAFLDLISSEEVAEEDHTYTRTPALSLGEMSVLFPEALKKGEFIANEMR